MQLTRISPEEYAQRRDKVESGFNISAHAVMLQGCFIIVYQSREVQRAMNVGQSPPASPSDQLDEAHPWNNYWRRGWQEHKAYFAQNNSPHTLQERAVGMLAAASLYAAEALTRHDLDASRLITPPLYREHHPITYPEATFDPTRILPVDAPTLLLP